MPAQFNIDEELRKALLASVRDGEGRLVRDATTEREVAGGTRDDERGAQPQFDPN